MAVYSGKNATVLIDGQPFQVSEWSITSGDVTGTVRLTADTPKAALPADLASTYATLREGARSANFLDPDALPPGLLGEPLPLGSCHPGMLVAHQLPLDLWRYEPTAPAVADTWRLLVVCDVIHRYGIPESVDCKPVGMVMRRCNLPASATVQPLDAAGLFAELELLSRQLHDCKEESSAYHAGEQEGRQQGLREACNVLAETRHAYDCHCERCEWTTDLMDDLEGRRRQLET